MRSTPALELLAVCHCLCCMWLDTAWLWVQIPQSNIFSLFESFIHGNRLGCQLGLKPRLLQLMRGQMEEPETTSEMKGDRVYLSYVCFILEENIFGELLIISFIYLQSRVLHQRAGFHKRNIPRCIIHFLFVKYVLLDICIMWWYNLSSVIPIHLQKESEDMEGYCYRMLFVDGKCLSFCN